MNKDKANNNKLLLNYLGDAVIYSSDLALLDCPTAWLNSDIIHFHFLRLQHQPHLVVGSAPDADGGHQHPNERKFNIDCLFLDPSVISFMMHQLNEYDEDYLDELSNLTSTWNLTPPMDDKKQHIKRIFLPINDQYKSKHMRYTPGQEAGGSHWSLLLVDIITATPNTTKCYYDETESEVKFYHFDSHRGYNLHVAKAVANKLYSVLKKYYSSTKTEGETSSSVNVNECQALQQNNGYDCGLYTLGFAEALLRVSYGRFDGGGNKSFIDEEKALENVFTSYMNDMGGQTHFASNLRKRIRDDIRELASKYAHSS